MLSYDPQNIQALSSITYTTAGSDGDLQGIRLRLTHVLEVERFMQVLRITLLKNAHTHTTMSMNACRTADRNKTRFIFSIIIVTLSMVRGCPFTRTDTP